MPTNFLSADTNFPRLTADEPVEKRLQQIRDYLYMLLEELRYTLANLGEENFNEQALLQMGETMTGPLKSVVTDLAGNVSSLEQTATSITARLDDVDGHNTTIEAFATGITSTVSDMNDNLTSVTQTATELTTTVEAQGGRITIAQQTANKINWIVASGGTETTFTLTSHMASLVADEISISGYVTFTSLENAASESFINGNNIALISNTQGNSMSSLEYKLKDGDDYYDFAKIYTRANQYPVFGERAGYAFVVKTPLLVNGEYCAMKFEAGESMSLETGAILYEEAQSQIVLNGLSFGTRIGAQGVIFDPSDSVHFPANTYCFCRDGIYYNGTRILST